MYSVGWSCEAIVIKYFLYIFQSFTRLTELVLHAHKKEMDAFQGSIDKYLDMTYLEGEQDKQDNSQKTCAC